MMRDGIWESYCSISMVTNSSSTVGVVLGECGTLERFSETLGLDFWVHLCTESPIGSTILSMTEESGLAISSVGENVVYFRKDSVPYSKTEKKVVNILHENDKILFKKFAIIAKKQKRMSIY